MTAARHHASGKGLWAVGAKMAIRNEFFDFAVGQ